MTQAELKQRTKAFALRIIKLADAIPVSVSGKAIAAQIVRSGTSVGANYRAACRAKSPRDFLNKILIVEEESDETGYWLELLVESGLMTKTQTQALLNEADELTALFTASGRTVRDRIQRPAGLQKEKVHTATAASRTESDPQSAIRNPQPDPPE